MAWLDSLYQLFLGSKYKMEKEGDVKDNSNLRIGGGCWRNLGSRKLPPTLQHGSPEVSVIAEKDVEEFLSGCGTFFHTHWEIKSQGRMVLGQIK